MSTGYKIEAQDGVYFLTFQVVKWIDLFTRSGYRDIVIESLKYCRENKQFHIFAYVVMSNHVHLLAQSGTGKMSDSIREFKSFTARKLIEAIATETESRREWMLNLFEFSAKQHKRNEKYQLWTHENHAEFVYSEKFMQQKINYIHDNPVRAGIVAKPEDFVYSSAGSYAGMKGLLDVDYVPVSVSKIPRMRTLK
ncbi:MAG: transposase [Bacteroidales bacterium 45-6]|nr:MAG: transposase [Bacteroidales bacterium 45-6]